MENGVRRWMVNISRWNPSEDRFASVVSLLPIHERSAITRFMKFEDKKRALVSRLLQYSLVHDVLGIPFDKITVRRTTEGKPYLENGEKSMFPNFNFNSSHHGDYVGIASEPVCLVGLDIISDAIPRQEAALEFVKNFSSYLTALEWTKIVNAGTPDEILANFYRYWCLKEAFVKAVGAGLGFGLRRLEFHHTNWSDISIYIDGVESRDWRFQLFEVDERHWASLAIGHPQVAVGSDKRTVAEVKFEEAEEYLQNALLPDQGGFILCSVDELISVSNRVQSVPCSGFSAS